MKRFNVLVVDQNRKLFEQLRFILEPLGRVDVAIGIQKAIEVLEFVNPDIVVLDADLNGNLQGLELLKHIHKANLTAKVILIAPQSICREVLKRSYHDGVSYSVWKPVCIQEFRQAVERVRNAALAEHERAWQMFLQLAVKFNVDKFKGD